MSAEKRLKELGIDLGTVSAPVANYVNAVRAGNLLFLAGKGPRAGKDGKRHKGKVGREYTVEQAYEHARTVGLDLIAVMRAELGSLDRVAQLVRVFGMVNCAAGFNRTPEVIDGCSDLLVAVFGDAGRHSRAAVGAGSLPRNVAVEVDAIFELA